MLCCGKKKDVIPPSQNNNSKTKNSSVQSGSKTGKQINRTSMSVKALKVYGVDDEIKIKGAPKGFKAIPDNNAAKYLLTTRPQNYAESLDAGHKSHMIGKVQQLNFNLEEAFGVANTFNIPTFDYDTLLNHNVMSRLNSKSKYEFDDGNKLMDSRKK